MRDQHSLAKIDPLHTVFHRFYGFHHVDTAHCNQGNLRKHQFAVLVIITSFRLSFIQNLILSDKDLFQMCTLYPILRPRARTTFL